MGQLQRANFSTFTLKILQSLTHVSLSTDQHFLILLSSAPAKAKVSSGPAHLHVQERRFCMTVGVPPRLVGTWEIGQLRRYGVVEGRFCFEGGSRCGRGEGLFVLITDQGDEIARAFQLAAEGKLPLGGRKRPHAHNLALTGSAQDSPRRHFSRSDTRGSDVFPGYAASLAGCFLDDDSCKESYWSSAESRPDDPELGYAGMSHAESHQACLERCASCVSGKSVKPSPLVAGHLQPRAFDRISLSSYSSSSHDSDYSASVSPLPMAQPHKQASRVQSPSPLALPPRPPKPSDGTSRPAKKPPMPLPPSPPQQPSLLCTCSSRKTTLSRNGKFAGSERFEEYEESLIVLTSVGASRRVVRNARLDVHFRNGQI